MKGRRKSEKEKRKNTEKKTILKKER